MKNFKDLLNHISENTKTDHDNAKAVFVVGVPGSGKDVVIRGILGECSIYELNHNQAYAMLCLEFVSNYINGRATAAIRNKSPLLITAPATDVNHIKHINESLEKLGYSTNLVFVNTTNDISADRNSKLAKTLSESIRVAKWSHCQENLIEYTNIFEDIIILDNSDTITQFNESVDRVCNITKLFIESTCKPTKTKQDISKFTNGKTDRNTKHSNLLSDNNCPTCQLVRISGKPDDIRYGDVAQNPGYSNRAYHEQTQPSLKVMPKEKISNFRKDKETLKNKYTSSGKDLPGKKLPTDGIGDQWSDRPNQGSGAFGNAQVEQKTFNRFRKEILEGMESGDTGYELGTVNSTGKESLQTLNDVALSKSPPRIKKKKVG